jgi:hypothetical protein
MKHDRLHPSTPASRYTCPCCGHRVLGEPPGSYEICGVCFWEDDRVQLRWPDWTGGANAPSLIDAQVAYAELGAIEICFIGLVRLPTVDELLDPGWRPIDPAVDSFEPRGIQERPWPQDGTTLYWWRHTFWRTAGP